MSYESNKEVLIKPQRYTAIDALRGAAILNMILYHAVWDLVYIFGIEIAWFKTSAAYIWQQGICWTFIFLSGFCFSLSKKPLKRGIYIFSAGLLISLVTMLFIPQEKIIFGVLTLIGSCALLQVPFRKVLQKINPLLGMIGSFAIFFIIRNVNQGYLGFESFNICKLPDSLYFNTLTAYLGFPPAQFHSADYFSLFPWLFLYLSGYFTYGVFKKYDLLRHLKTKQVYILNWIGRKSLVIYMLHQPILYLLLYIFFFITK